MPFWIFSSLFKSILLTLFQKRILNTSLKSYITIHYKHNKKVSVCDKLTLLKCILSYPDLFNRCWLSAGRSCCGSRSCCRCRRYSSWKCRNCIRVNCILYLILNSRFWSSCTPGDCSCCYNAQNQNCGCQGPC